MTLVTRGQTRSGKSIAEISLRELSVMCCVETGSGAKARLCKGTLCSVTKCMVTKIGGVGISADLTKDWGKYSDLRRDCDDFPSQQRAMEDRSKHVGNAPDGAWTPTGRPSWFLKKGAACV